MQSLGKWTVLAAAGLALGGCNTMHNIMGGEKSGAQQVSLSGANVVPPVSSGASGTGTVTVGSDCSVTANITVSGMKPTAAHIHQGKAGENGPVIVPFTKQGDNTFVAAPGAKMNEAQCAAYRAGNTYVNVHSDQYKPGEIRAQLKGH